MKVNVELTMSPYENAKLRALMVDDDYRADLLTFLTPWGDTAKVNIRDIREVEDDLSVEELAMPDRYAPFATDRVICKDCSDRTRTLVVQIEDIAMHNAVSHPQAVEPGNRGSVSDDD